MSSGKSLLKPRLPRSTGEGASRLYVWVLKPAPCV